MNNEKMKKGKAAKLNPPKNSWKQLAPIKVSSNFDVIHPQNSKDVPTSAKDNSKDKGGQNTLGNAKNSQQPSDPAPPTMVQSFATKLSMNQARTEVLISLSPPKITTKQGHPTVIFKKEDFMGKLADRCRFTLVGKFTNNMTRMEVIRRSFISQT